MKEQDNNAILTKSRSFAIRCINLYKFLCSEKNEYVMSKQLLRCGTSIGANVKEGVRGQSKADFFSKFCIALKEASETEYWLDLLHETNYITDVQYQSINADCTELIKLLTSICKHKDDN
ncbi:MAG: four helix bundle protein [Paludibacteraceae bacterium]|nr:four helix bundle protein [Paludibacteraceae bacterium]